MTTPPASTIDPHDRPAKPARGLGLDLISASPAPSAATGLGIVAGLVSVALRFAALPLIGDGEALLTAFPLILLASLIGGRWSGWSCLLVATIGSWYLFIGDRFSFSFGPNELGILMGTALAGAFVIELSMLLRRAFGEIGELRETERLLMRELQHRIKNTLTLVISIARQTFLDGRPPTQTFADFEGRMIALAAAQEVTGQGRGETRRIGAIVEQSLLPFCGEALGERLRLAGPDMTIEDEGMTVGLFLVFHELATNAAKYGALSIGGGTVEVAWSLDARQRLDLRWSERGGPRVAEPTRQGFGTTLMTRVIKRNLRGTVALTYAPSGLKVALSIPIRA